MRFTFDQLETFCWVARLSSFRGAAEHLGISQPSVSARVKDLELALGTRLLLRDKNKVILTGAGQQVMERAVKVVRLADEMASIGKRIDPMRGVMRLGANESVALTCLTRILSFLRERYPKMRVEVTIESGDHLSQRLNKRELDVAILTGPVTASFISDVRLGASRLEWIGSAQITQCERSYTASELLELPIITMAAPAVLYETVQNWFGSQGAMLEEFCACNSLSMIAQVIAEGQAIGVLPPAIVGPQIRSGGLNVLETTSLVEAPDFYISYQRDFEGGEMREITELVKALLCEHELIAADTRNK